MDKLVNCVLNNYVICLINGIIVWINIFKGFGLLLFVIFFWVFEVIC